MTAKTMTLPEGCLLTPDQMQKAQAEMKPWRDATPVRFLKDGRAVKLETGEMATKGSNVMYHPVYWNFDRQTARKIAVWTGTNAVFGK
jgi:hypothetical protein